MKKKNCRPECLTKLLILSSFLSVGNFTIPVQANHLVIEQQSESFTQEWNNTPLRQILTDIESRSQYVFMFKENPVFDKRISLKANQETITSLLNKLFSDTGITYSIEGKQIVLTLPAAKGTKRTDRPRKSIRGVVFDSKTQEPIIGATIQIKGASDGTITNLDGDFVLDCAPDDILCISYVGYDTKEIKVTSLNLYSVGLNEASVQLGEVVVTAFGVGQKKESLVGAVQQIKPQELKVPSSSLSTAFAGRMAGVIAIQRSGEPGADGANFWIRGKSTFSGATGALIIMDGVEISSAELNSLDPEAIESFSILKDATATALYGTRGANGVMIVTTKNGKDLDKPIINFRLEGSVSSMMQVPEW